MTHTQNSEFYAFISYSRKDIKDAKWIHSSLEKFHIPTKLPRAPEAEPIPKPLRCFRDINDLDVMPESFVKGIENALSSSKYLIVVCSPNSARSAADGNHYVDWEIQKFIEVHGLEYAKNHILPVIIDGKITHNESENECLPPSLYKLGDDFLEHNFPILDYGDENVLTKESKNDFILKILAFLLQVKYSVLNDRYQRAQRKRRHIVLGAAISLVTVFAVISVYAGFGWKKADKNLAHSYYMQANNLLQNKETSKALAYYKESLRLEKNPVVENQVYNLITNHSWLIEKEDVNEIIDSKFQTQEKICEKLKVSPRYGISLVLFSKGIQSDDVLLSFSADGKYAVVKRKNGLIKVIDVGTENEIFSVKPEAGFSLLENSFAFSNSGNVLVYRYQISSEKYISETYSVITKVDLKSLSTVQIREGASVSSVALSSDGEFLVYSAWNSVDSSKLVSYNLKEDKIQWQCEEKKQRKKIMFSPDNVHFATSGSASFGDSDFGKIEIRNVYDSKDCVSADISGEVASGSSSLVFSNDGRRLGVVTDKNEICILNVRNGSDAVERRVFDKNVSTLCFTPDDMAIQVRIGGKKCQFALQQNTVAYDMFVPATSPCIIVNALFLENDKYMCLLMMGSEKNYLEFHSLENPSADSVVLELERCGEYVGQFPFVKSPDEKIILVSHTDGIDVYEKNLLQNGEIPFSYKFRERLSYFCSRAKSISFIDEKHILVLEDCEKENFYIFDLESKEKNLLTNEEVVSCDFIDKNTICFVESSKTKGIDFALKTFDFKTQKSSLYQISDDEISELITDIKVLDKNLMAIFCNVRPSGAFYVMDKNHKIIYSKKAIPKGTVIQCNDDGTLIALSNVNGIVDVFDIKSKRKIFTTDTGFENNGGKTITQIDFVENSLILHISGQSNDEKGFLEVWDMSTSTKLSASENFIDSKIHGFKNLKNGLTVSYDYHSVNTSCNIATPQKSLMTELYDDEVFQILGGWTLNAYSVPELLEKNDLTVKKSKGNLCTWLTDFSINRKINPSSEKTKAEIFGSLSERNSNLDLVLDMQSDFQPALDDYYFFTSRKFAEKIYKNSFSVNSIKEARKLDSDWEAISASGNWRKWEAAKKMYKFYLDVYENKCPNSSSAFMAKYYFYNNFGETQLAEEYFKKADSLNPSDASVFKVRMLNAKNEVEQKKLILEEMNKLEKNEKCSFGDICTVFSSYLESAGMDSSFDELKSFADWTASALNEKLQKNTIKRSEINDIEHVAENMRFNLSFVQNGSGYYISWVEKLLKGVSANMLCRLKLDDGLIFSRIMDCIINNNLDELNVIYRDFKLSENMEYENLLLLQNMYWYYCLANKPDTDSLLDYLLTFDENMGMNFMASCLLTDIRLFDVLEIQNLYTESVMQKILKHSFNYITLENSVTIKDVLQGKQADKIGLKAGDKILYYANYPVNTATQKFFMNDLHKSELKLEKDIVPLIVYRDGKFLSFFATEGLLGLQL